MFGLQPAGPALSSIGPNDVRTNTGCDVRMIWPRCHPGISGAVSTIAPSPSHNLANPRVSPNAASSAVYCDEVKNRPRRSAAFTAPPDHGP